MQTDMGKEFYNTDVQRLMRKHDINHYSMYSVLKASVLKRFNLTSNNSHLKEQHAENLPRLVWDYNARKHQTISMRPVNVTLAIAERFLATVFSAIKIAGPAKFKVGDSVRVSKYKTIFEKVYTPNWTTEVFKIIKVQHSNPVTYLLEDYRKKSIAGAFYKHELHYTNYPDVYFVEKVLRKRGDEVYVK
ncbi:hypothetical protein ACFW04_007404 [Cataglyphis niger]